VETANALGCDLAAEVAGRFGRVCLRVAGTSMAPAIRPDDLISVERTSVTEVSLGEIVVFAREGRLIVHRVTARSESQNGLFKDNNSSEPCLVTRGDRTRRNDAPVSGSELIGRVTHIERGRSRISAPSHLNMAEQIICRLLRFSDRATYLYLHLALRWRELFPGSAECRV
jgi:signal peptidase I